MSGSTKTKTTTRATGSQPAPVVVGGLVSRVPGDVRDQVVYGDDGSVVIHAQAPIDGIVMSVHRPCLLVVDGARLRLTSVDERGAGRDRRFVYRCAPWNPGPFEREGVVVDYNPDRVADARAERASLVVRMTLAVLLLPLFPLVGLLPEGVKKKMNEAGIYPSSSQTLSLLVEWMLLLCVTAAEMVCIVAGAVWPAIFCGFIALMLLIDIPHRLVMASSEQRDVGFMSWPRQLWLMVRGGLHNDELEVLPDARRARLPPKPPTTGDS